MKLKFLEGLLRKIPRIEEISSRNIKIGAAAVMGVFIILTISGFFEILGVKTQYNIRQFFPDYHPLLRQDEIVKEKFKINDVAPYLLVASLPRDGESDWATKAHLDAVRAVTEKVKTVAKVKDVKSISNLQGAVQANGELGVGALIDYLTPQLLKKEIRKNPILSPLFVSRDALTLTIFVLTEDLPTGETEKLKNELLSIAKKGLPFAEVSIGGVPAIQSDVNEMISREVGRFIGVAVLMSILALALIFKNAAPILICTGTAFVTNILSVWGISIFGFSFNILSSTIPILVTMTVISICIHSILRLIERLNLEHAEKTPYHTVVLRTFHEIFRPNLLTALTTSVGFFTLTLSESPIIKEFGLSVGIALLVTWINAAVFLPACLLLAPKPVIRPWMAAKARWPFFILRFHKTILLSVILLSAFGAWKGQYLSWKARLFDDLPENHEVRRTTELVDNSLGGIVPLDVEIKLNEGESPWSQKENIEKLDEVAKEVRDKKGVGSLLTVSDILRSSGMMAGKNKATISEVLFLMSMSSDNPIKQYISADGQSTRLAIRLRDIPGGRMWNLVQDIRRATKAQFPNAKIRMAGTAAYVHDINNALSKDLLYGFWQAMLVIFILLVISYRSFVWAILACLPNLTPPSLLLGALSLWKIPIKPGIAIILSISLGLAFNNTVYLLERMRHMIKKGHSLQKSLFHTFWSEANPCFFSSMVLIVGFASFSISYFQMNRMFGIFMVLSVLTGLLGDLVMLPALLQFVLEKGSRFLKAPPRVVHVFVIFALGFSIAQPLRAKSAVDLNLLAERVSALVSTRDELGKIEMKIIESDGSTKTREISYSRLNEKNTHFTILRMLSPKDIKGTALLSVIKGGNADQAQEEKWIYLPTSKQTRRIATSEGSARILDSELYSEDFDLASVKGASSQVIKEEADGTIEIETKIPSGKSSYSKTLSWIGKDNLIKKSEVFDKKGALLKQVEFGKYIDAGGGKWRAGQIRITNVQNKRKTDLDLLSVKVNQNLKEKDFSTRALAESF
jgi:predicted RND superfamily exporter protein